MFLFIAAVLGPLLSFGATLRWSPLAGQIAIWALAAAFCIVALLPCVRRVSATTSWCVLIVACFAAALGMMFRAQLNDAVARALGFYASALPWETAQVSTQAWKYQQPNAGYTLTLPNSWRERPGPMPQTHELVQHASGSNTLAARLRPGCAISDEPLSMYVHALSKTHHISHRHCGDWQGMQTCLLRFNEPSKDGAERWEWLARQPASTTQIHLTFDLFAKSTQPELLAIIASTQPAPAQAPASNCPVPLEWAEP